jgi:hypothetical protein
MVLQARRNSAARAALIEEFGLLTSHELADLGGSTAKNRAALASRWKQEGRIFSVQHQGGTYYPAFQFEGDGQPKRAVALVLRALEAGDGWQTALWFLAENGYLEGRRPVDLLAADEDAVLDAVRHEAQGVFF